jgi:hypothetical protein
LYSKNEERGIYRTTDGGKSWNKTLFLDNETGIIDVAVSPKNFNIQYAAAWVKYGKLGILKVVVLHLGIYKVKMRA